MRRQLTAGEATQLARLVAKARVATEEVQLISRRLARDEFVLALLEAGASPSSIAESGGIDRATVYRIKTTHRSQMRRLEQLDAKKVTKKREDGHGW
jgi:DNA invertase Pin-like site-specific DNA recombinase